MRYGFWLLTAILIVHLGGCAPTGPTGPQTEAEMEPETEKMIAVQVDPLQSLDLPATFTGKIPCPDCLRVDISLTLRPDHIYQLRKTYVAKDGGVQKIESQMRNWRYSQDGKMVILGKQKGMLKTYVVVDDNTLRFLELESERGKSAPGYELRRESEVDRFSDTVKMRGMFSLRNDVAMIQECSSGSSFPVSRTGQYQEAVEKYLRLPHSYGEPLLLSLLGRVIRDNDTSAAAEDHVVIVDFKKFYLNQDCAGRPIRANLTDTVWSLREVGNRELKSFDYRNIPYLIFNQDNTIDGFGGCNTLAGDYLSRGNVLLFDRTVMTRVGCFKGVEVENLILEALDASESFEIEGDMLKVLDQNDQILAVFQADP